MVSSALQFDHVAFSYSSGPMLFRDLCLTLPPDGSIACVLGPSGSGKSTLIQLALRQLEPSSGTIHIKKGALPVFQEFDQLVLPWLSVRLNVTWAAPHRQPREVVDVLELLEILPQADRKAFRLSAGQRQRTALGRAIYYRAPLLLLDEPFANVDRSSMHRIVPRVRGYLQQSATSALWVTHSLEEAALVADIAWILHDSDPPKVISRGDLSLEAYLASLRGAVS